MSKKSACELCQKKPASLHYTEIADRKVSKLFICRQCAEQRGLLEEPEVEELMSSISKQAPDSAEEERPPCPRCGLDFEVFRQRGRLGCPECYDAFREELVAILREIHKQVQHTGKHPRGGQVSDARWQHLSGLRQALDLAVRTEDYERAAKLRDDIRQLQETPDDELPRPRTEDAAPEPGEGPA
jgi:protein arginine kinase activator